MVSIQNGEFTPIPFKQMVDPVTGRTRVRMVDIRSQSYRIARQYMTRLDDDDLIDSEKLARYGELVGLSPEAFRNRFAVTVRAGLQGQAKGRST